MIVRTLFAAAAAVLQLTAPATVKAADLYGQSYPPHGGAAYDDPRYADIYRDPPPREDHRRYRDDDDDDDDGDDSAYLGNSDRGGDEYTRQDRYPDDARPSYKDDDDRDALPPPRQRYSEAPGYGTERACVPRHHIRRKLIEDGWRDFHDLSLRGSTAQIYARRDDGRLFDLQVDRCTGEIISARAAADRAYGPWAYAPMRRNWRPY